MSVENVSCRDEFTRTIGKTDRTATKKDQFRYVPDLAVVRSKGLREIDNGISHRSRSSLPLSEAREVKLFT
jgi:hypothetical protein